MGITDLWVMAEVLQVNYFAHCVLILYNGNVYSVSLDDPIEDLGIPWVQLPTYALKPREYYFEVTTNEMVDALMKRIYP